MTLSETGESRVRGYLYILDRSLRASVGATLAADAVREVESHIRERVDESDGQPNEREALELILARLGPPGTVARAYSLEMILDEAAVGGRVVAVMRSLFHAALAGGGFFTAFLLFMGYAMGASGIVIALLKPVFPQNVGIWLEGGLKIGAQFPAPPGVEPLGGYWIVPLFLVVGLAVLIGTHRTARAWIDGRREGLRAARQHAGDARRR